MFFFYRHKHFFLSGSHTQPPVYWDNTNRYPRTDPPHFPSSLPHHIFPGFAPNVYNFQTHKRTFHPYHPVFGTFKIEILTNGLFKILSKFSFDTYGSIPEYTHTARTIEEAMSLLGKDIIYWQRKIKNQY